ncbi:hypothetical protein ACFCYN_04550 [Gottfriedia sp. NPDC056225]
MTRVYIIKKGTVIKTRKYNRLKGRDHNRIFRKGNFVLPFVGQLPAVINN